VAIVSFSFRYIFHYMVVRGITFLTMADDAAGFALPFAFLEDFAKSFLAMYGATVHTAIALAMQNSYGPRLKDLMVRDCMHPALPCWTFMGTPHAPSLHASFFSLLCLRTNM
ncbi:putative vesicle-associated membrane protein, partial [Toxoplasma gondii p89]